MLLQDPLTGQTSTGPTTLQEHKWDASWVFSSSENFLSRTSTSDAGLHMPGSCGSYAEDLVVVSWELDLLWCTTTHSTPRPWWTTQICSTGQSLEFSPRTLLSPMLTENGEPDRPQSTISTTEPPTDTDTESQDTCSGMEAWTNLSCPTWSTWEQTLSTEPSRETSTPSLNSNERLSSPKRRLLFFI